MVDELSDYQMTNGNFLPIIYKIFCIMKSEQIFYCRGACFLGIMIINPGGKDYNDVIKVIKAYV